MQAGTAGIRVTRLSDALPAGEIAAPALLKLDVQGFELPALEGCEGVLDRFDWVYVECSFMELYAGQPLIAAGAPLLRDIGCRRPAPGPMGWVPGATSGADRGEGAAPTGWGGYGRPR